MSIRQSWEFKEWRKKVFEIDKYTCQNKQCNQNGRIHPHHIYNFADYESLRFEVDNGITLCRDCHMEFHKIYGTRHNNYFQILDFLKNRKVVNA